jgi:gliding motility-associated-like protein
VKLKLHSFLSIIMVLISGAVGAQDIALYQQFNGRYDFAFIGNTLNAIENNSIPGQPSPPCAILSSSSATLNLNPNDVIQNAFLYWAGSGEGDSAIKLNNIDITAQRTFSIINSSNLPCFGAFADITAQVIATGNTSYTFSDLDLVNVIDPYCPSGGNFGGWAMVVVYSNSALPLNQLNVYDGMQGVPNIINITLNSLNVIDNQDAKIGFVAWEGDKNIAVNESLTINGTELENLPLNPANNAFNGTNSFTGSDQLFNMDLDVYNIQNNINIGDTSAQIQLTSGQDFVMINCIITKLNSQLPDATIVSDNVEVACNSRKIIAHYTVYNLNATNELQGGVPIAIYVNGIFIQYAETVLPIPINGSQSSNVPMLIPDTIPDDFVLTFVVDDDGTGHGIVIESDESNNEDNAQVSLHTAEPLPPLQPKISCNQGLTKGVFDFSDYENLVKIDAMDVVTFYASQSDLLNDANPIASPESYNAPSTPAIIYVKVDNGICFSMTSFQLITRNCPPTVYNYVSANNDSKNDVFFIAGLRDVFVYFRLSVYNRWGTLIWTGDNNAPDWDGFANKGLRIDTESVPSGTYFYALELNDPDYPKPLVGFLYLTRS